MSASSLSGLARKAAAGTTLTESEARDLIATTDLVTVGMIATEARKARVGDRVTYVRVAEITAEHAAAAPAAVGLPSGAVAPSVTSASVSASDATPTATAWPPTAAREIRITGAPGSINGAIASVRAVALTIGARAGAGPISVGSVDTPSQAAAAGTEPAAGVPPITAFSLADLWALAGSDAARLRELAQSLRDAGVVAIAEVPLDQFASLDVAAAAIEALVSAGLATPVAAWHEAPEDPVASLMALHALQERTHAFRAFAPLARSQSVTAPSTGYEDVKIVAVARTVLNNIDHIQVDWATHGPKLAQVALLFGASDLDRVSPSDDAPLGHRRAPIEEVQRNVKSAFLDPVERDGRFEQVGR
jgi:aminodeoxyfutalosine synthase